MTEKELGVNLGLDDISLDALDNESENPDHISEPPTTKGWTAGNPGQEAVQLIQGELTINLASSYIRADGLANIGLELFNRIKGGTNGSKIPSYT